MKRILSIVLVIAVLFSLASCRNINELYEETTAPSTAVAPPVVKENKQQKEFKDENGRTVYVVDVVLPEISENLESHIINYVNGVINEFFEDACAQAEKNIDSASEFMDKYDSDKPWKKTINFETTYISGYYVSFLIEESLSYYGSSDNDPSVYSRCFEVQNGNPVNAAYFTEDPETPEIAKGYIIDMLKGRAKTDFYRGVELGESQLAAFDEAVTLNDFYLTEDGMVFYVRRAAIDPEEVAGIYKAEFSWDELAGLFNKPVLY